jgi:hypothetical protein
MHEMLDEGHKDLQEEVYIQQPQGFKHPDFPNYVYQL